LLSLINLIIFLEAWSAICRYTLLAHKKHLQYLDIRDTKVVTVKPLLPLDKLEFLILDKKLVQDWSLLENKEGLTISENIILAQ